MSLQPIYQTKLYGLNNFFLDFIRLYRNKKLPNKILLSGDVGVGKSTLAYHLINYALSKDEKFKYDIRKFEISPDNKSYKLTTNGSNPNINIIKFPFWDFCYVFKASTVNHTSAGTYVNSPIRIRLKNTIYGHFR